MSGTPALDALVNAAGAYYRPAGRFALQFARTKLRHDPVFRAILEQGLLEGRRRLLDLGAGQGLLPAWLLAARECQASGRPGAWPPQWPAPPAFDGYLGIEINSQEVRRARRAFALDPGVALQFVHGDIVEADYGTPDAVVILDVLHYLDFEAQERVLARARAALSPGGLVVLRIGDASGGVGFALSKVVDRAVAFARRGRVHALQCRPLSHWRQLLTQLGFRSRAVPMAGGAPFTNVLLAAQLP
jgi:SAM-dependent methyltransferase